VYIDQAVYAIGVGTRDEDYGVLSFLGFAGEVIGTRGVRAGVGCGVQGCGVGEFLGGGVVAGGDAARAALDLHGLEECGLLGSVSRVSGVRRRGMGGGIGRRGSVGLGTGQRYQGDGGCAGGNGDVAKGCGEFHGSLSVSTMRSVRRLYVSVGGDGECGRPYIMCSVFPSPLHDRAYLSACLPEHVVQCLID